MAPYGVNSTVQLHDGQTTLSGVLFADTKKTKKKKRENGPLETAKAITASKMVQIPDAGLLRNGTRVSLSRRTG